MKPIALLLLLLVAFSSQLFAQRNGEHLSSTELKALHDENQVTAGRWQGLPAVEDPRQRSTRWYWWRNKPLDPIFEVGGVPFVQFENGAWLGHTFIYIAPLDSAEVYRSIAAKQKRNSRLRHYMYEASRDSTYSINLSGLSFNSIPEWVYEYRNLKNLTISRTAIRHLPERLNELDSLKSIYMDNMIHADSLSADALTNITLLSAKKNGWEKLPRWVIKLRNLKDIDLSENRFDHIPNRIAWLRDLKTIKVSKNPLNLEKQWLLGMHKLTNLRLNQCEITQLPKKFYRLKRLEELQLSDNLFTRIDPEIARLQKLKSLAFYKNRITELPPEFYQLTQLEIVDLFYNEIERISPEIAQLTKLKILYLANNRLIDIPDEVAQLPELQELYLHHNRLSDLPNVFTDLETLRVFHINNNYFMQFPDEILGMKNLVDLDFSYNDIDEIPLAVTQLDSLRLLFLLETEVNMEAQENQALKRTLDEMKAEGIKIGY